jgi:hypothetical protein
MEKVVYFLGAGFSAPLGIPTMANFLEYAKDMCAGNAERYSKYDAVFQAINQLSYTKNYYNADLFNIEEILSILEMQITFDGLNLRKEFDEFVCSVISHYTPSFSRITQMPRNWQSWIFDSAPGSTQSKWTRYGYFVASIFGVLFTLSEIGRIEPNYRIGIKKQLDKIPTYSLITTNYDMILENICMFINDSYSTHTRTETIVFAQQLSLDHAIGYTPITSSVELGVFALK